MADNYNIYQKCPNPDCVNGKIMVNDDDYDDGSPQEVNCNVCNGTGEIYWGQMREEEIE